MTAPRRDDVTTYPLYLYLTEETFGDLEIIGASGGLTPEQTGEIAMKLGLKVLLSADHEYGSTDYGSGPVKVADFDDKSLGTLIKAMHQTLREEEEIRQIGLVRFYWKRTNLAHLVNKIVAWWGHHRTV